MLRVPFSKVELALIDGACAKQGLTREKFVSSVAITTIVFSMNLNDTSYIG